MATSHIQRTRSQFKSNPNPIKESFKINFGEQKKCISYWAIHLCVTEMVHKTTIHAIIVIISYRQLNFLHCPQRKPRLLSIHSRLQQIKTPSNNIDYTQKVPPASRNFFYWRETNDSFPKNDSNPETFHRGLAPVVPIYRNKFRIRSLRRHEIEEDVTESIIRVGVASRSYTRGTFEGIIVPPGSAVISPNGRISWCLQIVTAAVLRKQ